MLKNNNFVIKIFNYALSFKNNVRYVKIYGKKIKVIG